MSPLERGLSLIEMMVTVAIMAILVMVAAPSYTNYLNSQAIRNVGESLVSGLHVARGESIRSNATTVFQVVDSLTNACAVDTDGRHWVVSHCSAAGACGQDINKQAAPPVNCADGAVILAKGSFDASDKVNVDFANSGALCYSALGRVNATASNCPQNTLDPAAEQGGNLAIDITHADEGCIDSGGEVRCLRLTIGFGGQARLCDPDDGLPANDPRRC